MDQDIVGKGTWIDKVAHQLIEREKALSRSTDLLRTESGIGASGIVHVGNMMDVVRAYGVSLALRNLGHESETIAFSDDMDGLRKIPEGMPSWLEKHLLQPVSIIPDPFGCHKSYGAHASSILREALDMAGVRYEFKSGAELYSSGQLAPYIRKILLHAEAIGRHIRETVGQEKYTRVLPYFPICDNCNRIYTTKALGFDASTEVVHYSCEDVEIAGEKYRGCGHDGDSSISKGRGKLLWVGGEFASRWALLDIRFEAFGKDLTDSAKINDWICKNVLNFEPPMHIRYELLLDVSGRKISKSRGLTSGLTFTPQEWYKIGSPQSLLLLFYKRYVGTRTLSRERIPELMDELDHLEEVYFEKTKTDNPRERAKLRGLYEYVHHLNPPPAPSVHIPYRVLVELANVAPTDDRVNYVVERIRRYGYSVTEEVRRRIEYALNYAGEFRLPQTKITISELERNALSKIVESIRKSEKPEQLQSGLFQVARDNGIEPSRLFETLYNILLGVPSGPRLGPYIFDIGKDRAIETITKFIS